MGTSAHRLSTWSSRSATLFSMRKMSINSWGKERAIVLQWGKEVAVSITSIPTLSPGRGENARLRSAAIWLPVAVELFVRPAGHFGCAV